jgi:hypothetical protein
MRILAGQQGSSMIKPIETSYAGCRFRSRLEARWAVFFDKLGVKWEYEPQGYMIGGVHNQPKRWYLPDFYLPEHGTWVEVKGAINNELLPLLALAVDPFSGGSLPLDSPRIPMERKEFSPSVTWDMDIEYGTSLGILLLGEIPRTDHLPSLIEHEFFYPHKSAVRERRHFTGSSHWRLLECELTYNHVYDVTIGGWDLECAVCYPHRCASLVPYHRVDDTAYQPKPTPTCVLDAYDAARSARFEHGQMG